MRVDASDVTGPLLGLLALVGTSFLVDDSNTFKAFVREMRIRGPAALLVGAGLAYFVSGIRWGRVGQALSGNPWAGIVTLALFLLFAWVSSSASGGEMGVVKVATTLVLGFALVLGAGVVGTVAVRLAGGGITVLRRLTGV